MLFEALDVHITKALMIRKFCSVKVAFADLTLNDDFWAVPFNMLEQLRPSHVLVIFAVAYVTAILRTIIDGMLLQLGHCLPNHDLTAILPTLVRKLAEINTVLQDLVYRLQEISSFTTAWTAFFVLHIDIFGDSSFVDCGHILLSLHNRQFLELLLWNSLYNWISKLVLIVRRCATHHLRLAVLTKQLVASFAFCRQERCSTTNHALDFFDHLFLQLVSDKRNFDIKGWEWLRPHDFLDGLIRN